MSASARILVIGAGNMGSSHVRVAAGNQSCRLIGVVDPDPVNGPLIAARYGTRWRPEVDDLAGVDGVVLAAPTPLHLEIGKQIVDAGVPVLVEKPLTDGLAATEELLAASLAASVPIMCGFVERFNPAVQTARALLTAPVHVQTIRHSPYAPRIKNGVSWDLLVHDVDLALQILGPEVDTVQAATGFFAPQSEPGAEDVVDATLTFAGGAIASVSASRIGHRKIRSMSISELDRTIEIDLLRRDVTVYRHVDNAAAEQGGKGYRQQTIIEIPEPVTNAEPLVAQFEHFLALVAGRVDADTERAGILPAHRVIARINEVAGPSRVGRQR